ETSRASRAIGVPGSRPGEDEAAARPAANAAARSQPGVPKVRPASTCIELCIPVPAALAGRTRSPRGMNLQSAPAAQRSSDEGRFLEDEISRRTDQCLPPGRPGTTPEIAAAFRNSSSFLAYT